MNRTRGGSSQKERVLHEAVLLFWKKGYHDTTMKDIATAYGCKPANIYNFFPQKEAILYEILRSQIETIISYIKPLEDDETTSPVEQLRFFIIQHATYALGHKKTNKLLFDIGLDRLSPAKRKKFVALRDTYDRILCKIITRGIKSGDFQEIDVKLAAYSIASMIMRVNIWYSPDGRLSNQEIIHFYCDFALRGLRGEAPKSKQGIAKGRNTRKNKTPV
ncbi:MAG: TetR/AcrR family transcriptional regulator [Deltaproteobacteria bacterium]|nr:TetR/AcrR family transcriptional regulator [Deltaproteobacteria bacterium]